LLIIVVARGGLLHIGNACQFFLRFLVGAVPSISGIEKF
jgi:hypothetical protein